MDRDWKTDWEMCEAATSGPWKVFRNGIETLICTEYDHIQLQGPDSIVGHAYGIKGEYVYIREADAKLLAESITALPYWLKKYADKEDVSFSLEEILQQVKNLNTKLALLHVELGEAEAYKHFEAERTKEAQSYHRQLEEAKQTISLYEEALTDISTRPTPTTGAYFRATAQAALDKSNKGLKG